MKEMTRRWKKNYPRFDPTKEYKGDIHTANPMGDDTFREEVVALLDEQIAHSIPSQFRHKIFYVFQDPIPEDTYSQLGTATWKYSPSHTYKEPIGRLYEPKSRTSFSYRDVNVKRVS